MNLAAWVIKNSTPLQSAGAAVSVGPASVSANCTVRLGGSASCAGALPPVELADDDGVAAAVEEGAPNGGDGNADGVADSAQAHVASLPNGNGGGYVTLVSPVGTALTGVTAGSPSPVGSPLPSGVTAPQGTLGFSVTALRGSRSTSVTVFAGGSADWNGFHEGGSSPIWAALPGRAVTFTPSSLTLTLVDGGTGDVDSVTNGTIVVIGAPTHDPVAPVE